MGLKDDLKKFLIERAVKVLVSQLDKETIEKAITKALVDGKDLVDSIIDTAKEKIRESETDVDDRILLPVLEIVEKVLGLDPD